MQEKLDFLARDQAGRQHDRAVTQSDGHVEQVGLFFGLAAGREVLARRQIVEHVAIPVGRLQELFDRIRRQSAGIGSCHGRASTGACDAVDRNLESFEGAQDPDMGKAPGPTARQGQADSRAVGGIDRRHPFRHRRTADRQSGSGSHRSGLGTSVMSAEYQQTEQAGCDDQGSCLHDGLALFAVQKTKAVSRQPAAECQGLGAG